MEKIPPKWREKIIISTDISLWYSKDERGGYTVHPVPAPPEKKEDPKRKNIAGKIIQSLKLLRRGKCISLKPNINGKSQLENPPIKMGITTKKIITKAWEVTNTL